MWIFVDVWWKVGKVFFLSEEKYSSKTHCAKDKHQGEYLSAVVPEA
jgi:hypothetical protein